MDEISGGVEGPAARGRRVGSFVTLILRCVSSSESLVTTAATPDSQELARASGPNSGFVWTIEGSRRDQHVQRETIITG
jgi:hypothetical protein